MIFCLSCRYAADRDWFGSITMSSDGGSLVGRLPTKYVGSVDILVCPECGSLHCDMRGEIKRKDRGGRNGFVIDMPTEYKIK